MTEEEPYSNTCLSYEINS